MAKGNSPSAAVMASCSVEVGGLSFHSCGGESCGRYHAVSKGLDLFWLMPWKEGLGLSPLLLSPTCSHLVILVLCGGDTFIKKKYRAPSHTAGML